MNDNIPPFRNLLNKGDEVMDTKSGLRGRVTMQPRASSPKAMCQMIGLLARYYPVARLRRVLGTGAPLDLPLPYTGTLPAEAGPLPGRRCPADMSADSEKTEREILANTPGHEARAEPISMLDGAKISGEHLKHYIINYVTKTGKFHVEKLAAKGIVSAITQFYIAFNETAIVSVICVL